MSTLEVRGRDFLTGFKNLNILHSLHVSELKCLKFASTIGISHFSPAYQRSVTALSLAVYKALALKCAVDFSQPTLRLHAEYSHLESSEKANLSFWLGMTFATIAAAELLQVPRMIHAAHHHGLVRANPNSRRLADLVGQDSQNRWHVVEAKARQRKASAKDRQDWKQQAQTVGSINGTAVSTQSYCFTQVQSRLESELVDPPGDDETKLKLKISPTEFSENYYKPFLKFLEPSNSTQTVGGRTARVRVIAYDPVASQYLHIGLDDSVYNRLLKKKSIKRKIEEHDKKDLYIGTDGIAVMTSQGPCDFIEYSNENSWSAKNEPGF